LKLEMPLCKRTSDDEHEQIYRACRSAHLDRATGILAAHLLDTGTMLARYLQGEPQGGGGSA
jgi:DNA-binding GntR family transcriptional regulator